MRMTHRIAAALSAAALPFFAAGTAGAQTYSSEDGWDYNIIDSTQESYLPVNYATHNGVKIDTASFVRSTYSGVEGADGSRVADFNGDRKPDILTVYEESKKLFVYENTSPTRAHANSWKRHLVGLGCGASEEAIFFDYDGDNYPDIICVATSGGPGVAGEQVYAYRNKSLDAIKAGVPCGPGISDSVPSNCWDNIPTVVGYNVLQKDWYRVGGDMGSADFNKDGCPDLIIGSAGGDVGVLWCPDLARRANLNLWRFERVWAVNNAEVQKVVQVPWGGQRWLAWSVKDPNKGVYVARWNPRKKKWTKAVRIVSDVYSMEFAVADLDLNGDLDLILPTRDDVGGRGAVRVYWGYRTDRSQPRQKQPWNGASYTRLTLPWANVQCDHLRNENIAKGVAVGELIKGAGGQLQDDIAVMGRGCPYAANGIFYYNSTNTTSIERHRASNWRWRSLTNQYQGNASGVPNGKIMQDDEEQKWDAPQLYDMDGDGDLDIVGSDENGDWKDTFGKGIFQVDKGADPHDKGVGTVIFWNQ